MMIVLHLNTNAALHSYHELPLVSLVSNLYIECQIVIASAKSDALYLALIKT